MKTTLAEAKEKLEQYVNLPSGSHDQADVNAFADVVQADFEALGMEVIRHPDECAGDTLECRAGTGKNELLLLGHMDTVFARGENWPFRVEGDKAFGPGAMDMKGGLLVMYFALKEVLPALPNDTKIVCVLNADEEIGSQSSHALIEAHAKQAFAALSFEPVRPSGALVAQRKGVISFHIRCTGQRGHAGSAYLECASAIEQICGVVNALYTLRDDARSISINVGRIEGGSGENIIADEANAYCELRFFDPAYQNELLAKVREICDRPGIQGTTTELHVGASHPPFKANDKSARLLEMARQVAEMQGRTIKAESTGGAGDIAFAGLQGIAALDGLGIAGFHAHAKAEYALMSSLLPNAQIAAELMRALLLHPERVM